MVDYEHGPKAVMLHLNPVSAFGRLVGQFR
jgi:hypothetical protein